VQLDPSVIEMAEQAAHEGMFRSYGLLFSRVTVRFKGDESSFGEATGKVVNFLQAVERCSNEQATTSFAECYGQLGTDEALAGINEIDERLTIFIRAVNWFVSMVGANRIIELEHAIGTLGARDLYGMEAVQYLESVQSQPASLIH